MIVFGGESGYKKIDGVIRLLDLRTWNWRKVANKKFSRSRHSANIIGQ